MQTPTGDRHPRSWLNVRIYSGTEIYVCYKPKNATLPSQKFTFVRSREATSQYRVPNCNSRYCKSCRKNESLYHRCNGQRTPRLVYLKSCSDLADHLTCRVFEEVRLIFDRYNLPSSLKKATRKKRWEASDLFIT